MTQLPLPADFLPVDVPGPGSDRTIIYTTTHETANKIYNLATANGIPLKKIHVSNKSGTWKTTATDFLTSLK